MQHTPESRMRTLRQDQAAEGTSAHERLRDTFEKCLPPMVRPSRLAWLVDMPRQRIYELVEMGELDAVRIGKRGMRIPKDSILRWLVRHSEKTQG